MDYQKANELQERLLADFIFIERGNYSIVGSSANDLLKKELRTMAKGIGITKESEVEYGLKFYMNGDFVKSKLSRYLGIEDNEIEVENTGIIRMQANDLRPGYSAGHYDVGGGTLGGFVRDKDNVIHILSNNHVLANQNRARLGDGILHPCKSDGGDYPQDVVGYLSKYEPLLFDGQENWVDCAMARAKDQEIAQNEIPGFGRIEGKGKPSFNQKVVKYGKNSNLTEGTINELKVNIVVEYAPGNFRNKEAWFRDQMAIRSTVRGTIFSRLGDSGSLIVDYQSHLAVGLLFAASEFGTGSTFACPIESVLTKLGVDLL